MNASGMMAANALQRATGRQTQPKWTVAALQVSAWLLACMQPTIACWLLPLHRSAAAGEHTAGAAVAAAAVQGAAEGDDGLQLLGAGRAPGTRGAHNHACNASCLQCIMPPNTVGLQCKAGSSLAPSTHLPYRAARLLQPSLSRGRVWDHALPPTLLCRARLCDPSL